MYRSHKLLLLFLMLFTTFSEAEELSDVLRDAYNYFPDIKKSKKDLENAKRDLQISKVDSCASDFKSNHTCDFYSVLEGRKTDDRNRKPREKRLAGRGLARRTAEVQLLTTRSL